MSFLKDLTRNSRVCIIVEPMWAVFGGLIFFYAPLYMESIGLTHVQIGLASTATIFMNFLCNLFASSIVNRLGRRRTSLIFDLISWSVPMFIWAVAQNFWHFMAASLINGFVRIVHISWFLLLSEDAENHQRSKIFAIINLINFASGLMAPLTGLLIAQYSTVPVIRILYGAGMISMTLMFFLRNALTTETKNGLEMMKKHESLLLWHGLSNYFRMVRKIITHPYLLRVQIIYILTTFLQSMNFVLVLYYSNQLAHTEKSLSIIPGVSALVNLFLFIVDLPRISKFKEEKNLAFSFLISIAGIVLLFFIPAINLIVLLVSTSLLAVGTFIHQTFRDTLFMNNVEESEKADAFSAIQNVSTLAVIPAGVLTGFLYSVIPQLPFMIMLVLMISAFLISLSLLKQNPVRLSAAVLDNEA